MHTRRVAFVDGRLLGRRGPPRRGRTPHRYDLRFHLAPDAEGRVAVERRDGSSVVRAPGVALVVVGDAAPVVEPGWTSPDYGIRHAAPVVSIVADGAADATFTTLVLPLADGAGVPDVALRRARGRDPLEVTGARLRRHARWSEAGLPLDLGPLRCRAAAGLDAPRAPTARSASAPRASAAARCGPAGTRAAA